MTTTRGRKPETRPRFIVICQSIVGSMSTGFETIYGWDGEKFETREDAIRHGWKLRESDDFNIGVLERGLLAQFCWMDELCDHDLHEIGRQTGLRCKREVSHA